MRRENNQSENVLHHMENSTGQTTEGYHASEISVWRWARDWLPYISLVREGEGGEELSGSKHST